MKISLVTTTINIPVLLEEYAFDLIKSPHEIDIIIAGDKKTPSIVATFCKDLEKKSRVKVHYMDINFQNKFMQNFPELNKFLPWDCIQRRNLAIMLAYLNGSEIIITIDDDNYITHNNYLRGHDQIGIESSFTSIKSPTGWLNICDFLHDQNEREFYARGHPWLERINKVQGITQSIKKGRIVVNAGFWLGEPDVDAVTRLANPIKVIGYKLDKNFTLDVDTWAPFNSQNTALHRDVIPAYFLAPNIGRFDDIWASYIVKKISDHLGDYISFGFPIVKQVRNNHDLWIDADLERVGIQLSDNFCKWLKEIKLTGKDYFNCATELINKLESRIQSSDISSDHKQYCQTFIDGYKTWFKTIERLNEVLESQ